MQNKFKQYMALRKALERLSVDKPGPTATLLLNAFVVSDGKIFARDVVDAGLCLENNFKPWRDKMVQMGILVYNFSEQLEKANTKHHKGDLSKHQAGHVLVDYINKEIMSRSVVATVDDISALNKTLRTHETRMSKQEELLKSVCDFLGVPHNPPDHPELKQKLEVVK